MHISDIFKAQNIILELKSSNKKDLFEEMIDFLVKKNNLENKSEILDGLWERENQFTTGIASKIAIPHAHITGIQQTFGIIGISKKGIEYDALDGQPVFLVFMIINDKSNAQLHLEILKNIAMLISKVNFFQSVMNAKSEDDIYNIIQNFE